MRLEADESSSMSTVMSKSELEDLLHNLRVGVVSDLLPSINEMSKTSNLILYLLVGVVFICGFARLVVSFLEDRETRLELSGNFCISSNFLIVA